MQGSANDGQLLLTAMRKTKRTPHHVRSDQCACWLEQFCIGAKCFDVDACIGLRIEAKGESG
jgi:hypothetical protein